mmetsp:Transcript_20434/g.44112  ORF Transcript_20434/g.44112 Transcript_20434/m.44112 type:complete len:89 (+) Transcript_20434:2975-3241(+)
MCAKDGRQDTSLFVAPLASSPTTSDKAACLYDIRPSSLAPNPIPDEADDVHSCNALLEPLGSVSSGEINDNEYAQPIIATDSSAEISK